MKDTVFGGLRKHIPVRLFRLCWGERTFCLAIILRSLIFHSTLHLIFHFLCYCFFVKLSLSAAFLNDARRVWLTYINFNVKARFYSRNNSKWNKFKIFAIISKNTELGLMKKNYTAAISFFKIWKNLIKYKKY